MEKNQKSYWRLEFSEEQQHFNHADSREGFK